MHSASYPPRPVGLALALIIALGLVVVGCSSDDDTPTTPGGEITEFNEELADAQASVTAPMAIEMVENMPFFADGFTGKDFSYTFAWDSEYQAWSAHTTYDAEGYSFEFAYYVQFRDAQGNPQMTNDGAVSMHYVEDGVGDFSYEDDRSALYAHQEFSNEMEVDGLDTTTLVIAGSGGYDFTYEAYSDGNQATLDLTVTWETLGGGISFPENGCPTGSIRYHFSPYYVDVVFDGDDTVNYTLYNAEGTPVQGGSGTEMMTCGN